MFQYFVLALLFTGIDSQRSMPQRRPVGDLSLPKNAKITSGCGGLLTDAEGVFTSPNYPDPYGLDLDCRWIIQLSSDQRVLLVFHNVSTEFFYDRIMIYDGSDTSAALLHEVSGYGNSAPVLTSSSNVVLVQLVSDSWNSMSGFLASYRADFSAKPNCSQVLTSPIGIIQSPEFENSFYPTHADCHWIIKVDGASSIRVSFSLFNTQAGRDILAIEDPFSPSPLLLQHSGPVLPDPVASTSNQLIIRFKSDASVSYYRGFQLRYTAS